MGHVKIDLIGKTIRNDVAYEYSTDGISRLLGDMHRLVGEALSGDKSMSDAVSILADLQTAIESGILTSRQRQVISLYYTHDLTMDEICPILGARKRSIDKSLDVIYKRVAEYLVGGPKELRTSYAVYGIAPKVALPDPLRRFLDGVSGGVISPIQMMGDDELLALQTFLAGNDRKMAQGMADNNYDEDGAPADLYLDRHIKGRDGKTYVITAEKQMRPHQEILMHDADRKENAITRRKKRPKEYGSVESSRGSFYVGLPDDRLVKRYGSFWTYHRNSPVTVIQTRK